MTITGKFNKLCEKEFEPLGFVRVRSKLTKKSFFVRVVGNVLQFFFMDISGYVSECRVDFDVLPLGQRPPVYLEGGGYTLSRFISEEKAYRFDSISSQSIRSCVESMIADIKVYLMPFFDQCADSGSALHAVIDMERVFEEKRQAWLLRNGEQDMAQPWQERSLMDSNKYYLALQAQDWAYACRYLEFHIDQHQRQLSELDDPVQSKQQESLRKNTLVRLECDSEHLDMLRASNVRFFEELLKDNKDKLIDFFQKNYSGIGQGWLT